MHPARPIPLGGFGFTSSNLNQNGLGGVPLSSIRLKSSTDTWQARLNASPNFSGTPVQSVTLAQVLGTSVVTTPTPVTLDDVDLESSPLGSIPLGSIALGGLPLGSIPLDGDADPTTAENLAAWCAFINAQPGYSCTNPDSLNGQTMMGIGLQGVPLGRSRSDHPARINPLGSSRSPTSRSDRSRRRLAARIDPARIDRPRQLAARTIPLADRSRPRPRMRSSPARRVGSRARTRTRSPRPRGRRDQAGRQVEDIGYYCTPGAPPTEARVAGHTPILLKDFVNGLPADVTVEDLLGTILSEAAYDWEALPLPGFPIQDFSEDGGINDYAVDFTLTGDEGGSTPVSIAVKIPDGARYVLGSSSLSVRDAALPDPTLNKGNELGWQLTNIPLNRTSR